MEYRRQPEEAARRSAVMHLFPVPPLLGDAVVQQSLHLGVIGGGWDVQSDHVVVLNALAVDPEFLKRVDRALPCGSRAALTQHDEANGAVPRATNHGAGPSHVLLIGLYLHDVAAGDFLNEPGVLSSRAVLSPWSTARRLSTDAGGQSSSTSSRKCTFTHGPPWGFGMPPRMHILNMLAAGEVTGHLYSEVGSGSSVPQPTTVSHDGGCADRPGAPVPRCTPTGLSHAVGVCASTRASREDRPVTTAREQSAWEADVF